MSVKATVQPLEGSKVALEVEVAAEDVRRGLEAAYQRLARKVKIPGFRPGHVPPQVLKARLGRQPVYDEALESLLPDAYRQAVAETRIEPVDDPHFDVVQMEDDKPLVFRAEVTVKPEAKLGTYKEVPAERRVVRVVDADVDRVLRRIQERFAVLEPAEGAVQRGLFVEVDYEALLEGKPFRGGAARNRTVEIGREQVAPGWDDAVVGMQAGETRQFALKMPDDQSAGEMANKTLSFSVTLRAIKRKRLPELDDDLARDVGAYDSLEALEQAVRNALQEAVDRRASAAFRRQVVDKVVQGASVDIPEPMVSRRTDRLLRNLAERLAAQGLTVERYLELSGRSAAELVKSLEPEARRQLTEEMVLDAVARQEDLKPDPQALDRQVDEVMTSYARSRSEGEGRRAASPERLAQLREDVRDSLRTSMSRERAVDWLVEHARPEDREVEGVQDDDAELEAIFRVERPATAEAASAPANQEG